MRINLSQFLENLKRMGVLPEYLEMVEEGIRKKWRYEDIESIETNLQRWGYYVVNRNHPCKIDRGIIGLFLWPELIPELLRLRFLILDSQKPIPFDFLPEKHFHFIKDGKLAIINTETGPEHIKPHLIQTNESDLEFLKKAEKYYLQTSLNF